MPLDQPYKVLIDRIINHEITWDGESPKTIVTKEIISKKERAQFFAVLRNGKKAIFDELTKAIPGGYNPKLETAKEKDFEEVAKVFSQIVAAKDEEAYRYLRNAIIGLLAKEESSFCEAVEAACRDMNNYPTRGDLEKALKRICDQHTNDLIHDTY